MAPQSIIAVFDCWNIVVALAVAPWWFGESVSRRTMMSALLLVFGCSWVVSFGPKSYHPQTVKILMEAFVNPFFESAALASMVVIAVFASRAYLRWNTQLTPLTAFEYCVVSANFAWFATLLSKSTA